MEEITNLVTLKGVLLTDIVDKSEIWGLVSDVKCTNLESVRNSGTADTVQLVIPASISTEGMAAGSAVMCWGKIQTIKEYATGHVGVFVLVEEIRELEGDHWEEENEVVLIGELGRRITYRQTPKGKRITDFTILTKGEVRHVEKSLCFIPCICWNKDADKVKDWKEGELVKITARCQSRKYDKQLDNAGTHELRTAYELSIKSIEKVEG